MGEVPNVFIFNKIKKNDADISLLKQTFASLNCNVIEVKNDTLDNLNNFVNRMIHPTTDFSKFNYVIIIVLDNTNVQGGLWDTIDQKIFHINGDLFVKLFENASLKGKLRLGILQTNREFNQELAPKIFPRAMLRSKSENASITSHRARDAKLYATSIGAKLTHNWRKGEPSPFVRVVCEEFGKTLRDPQLLEDILNRIASRVEKETGELPAKEIDGFPFCFGQALSPV